jgi:hypothetical protein
MTPQKANASPYEIFWAAVLEFFKGSVERARSGAEFVEKAAASVATVYAGVLGVAFSVSDNPLPLRGLIPAVFLCLAIAGAAYYLAYPSVSLLSMETPDDDNTSLEEWTNAFTKLVMAVTTRRGWAIRAGIVSLAFGVLFLPAPFLKVKTAPPKPAAEIPWPTLPPANLPLTRILFLEQVREAARNRREGIQTPAGRKSPPIAWPTVPSVNAPLARVLFTEQVKEVSRLRSEAKPTPIGQWKTRERNVWWVAVGALFVVALTAISTKLLDRRREREPNSPSQPSAKRDTE